MKNFSELQKKLGIKFKNKDLLVQSFCHRSYLNENPDFLLFHNERLEFLGDAVLELVVTEFLFQSYPKKLEGVLTNWRASLVNAKTLAEVAQDLDFNDFLLLSKGEQKELGKARFYILADVFEAFIGALYLDQGYSACDKFIKKCLLIKLDEIIEKELFRDPKSSFQEQAQEIEKITPTYRILSESGPDHAKDFVVGIFLGKKMIAKGRGLSKQEAEEQAAKEALEVKGW
ncbi:MAG: ribonuclease III [Candidatus Pacebacteria bacterium]|nr:ribonuclease III [Candidatus Paceibacterota bacterium]